VDNAGAESDVITTGSVVTLRYEGDDEPERYLVGSIEERMEGVSIVSPSSPLGQALLGQRPGQVVSYEAPGGQLQVEIVAVGR
jgi:transcription elongation factor GreA